MIYSRAADSKHRHLDILPLLTANHAAAAALWPEGYEGWSGVVRYDSHLGSGVYLGTR
jgi:hypothetical protein